MTCVACKLHFEIKSCSGLLYFCITLSILIALQMLFSFPKKIIKYLFGQRHFELTRVHLYGSVGSSIFILAIALYFFFPFCSCRIEEGKETRLLCSPLFWDLYQVEHRRIWLDDTILLLFRPVLTGIMSFHVQQNCL